MGKVKWVEGNTENRGESAEDKENQQSAQPKKREGAAEDLLESEEGIRVICGDAQEQKKTGEKKMRMTWNEASYREEHKKSYQPNMRDVQMNSSLGMSQQRDAIEQDLLDPRE